MSLTSRDQSQQLFYFAQKMILAVNLALLGLTLLSSFWAVLLLEDFLIRLMFLFQTTLLVLILQPKQETPSTSKAARTKLL